ncbi:unnamed protein product [Arctogadus glacialis]
MAAFLITCVIIQAVLLWDIDCRPLKNGPMYKAQSTGGGYKAPGVYQAEVEVNPGYGGTSSQSGHGYQDGSAMAPPPGYDSDSTHGASQDGSWVMSPIAFSGGQGGSSISPRRPFPSPPPQESFPGELLQVEATNEKGAYESETQEKGTPPLPASAPQLGASMPSAFSRGSSFPFNMRFLRGQYLPGTYTDYTSSLENERDDSQENHYIVYDSPSSSEEEQQQQQQQWEGQQQEWDSVQPVWRRRRQQQQQGQTIPRASPQSVQMASLGMPSGSGQQAQSFPTSVIIQAVLLWDIDCRPLKNGPMYKAQSTGGGYKAPGVYQAEVEVNPGYGGTSSQSGHGYQDGSAMAPPPGYDSDSTHGASQDGSWVMSPIAFSGGQGGSSISPRRPFPSPPPQESFPGELLQVEATNEKGAYESETQEKGTPPLPASAPQLGASMPSAFSRGSSFPFNMRFLRGQYLPGTYTDYTSSLENERDDSQENHYIVYDSPSSSEEEQQQQQQQQQWEGQQQEWDSVQPVWRRRRQQQQQGQTIPRASPQSVQMASLGMPSGSGQQAQSFPTRYYQ